MKMKKRLQLELERLNNSSFFGKCGLNKKIDAVLLGLTLTS